MLRGHVVKRERESFGTARFRVRATAMRVRRPVAARPPGSCRSGCGAS